MEDVSRVPATLPGVSEDDLQALESGDDERRCLSRGPIGEQPRRSSGHGVAVGCHAILPNGLPGDGVVDFESRSS